MPKYRHSLPQLNNELFLTDGGIETTLIFHEGFNLPHVAAFTLLAQELGRRALDDYFRRHAAIARHYGVGFILESVTWRANRDWAEKIGYSTEELAEANRSAIRMLEVLRSEFESSRCKAVISGCVGPRGDGYVADEIMSEGEAEAYHAEQIGTFAGTTADMVAAITMTNVPEAIGITRAAAAEGMPVAISFTTETDGRIPSGESLREAIEAVDEATGKAPAYYMINCAHPTHFEDALEAGEDWVQRIRGIRANASRMSHAELDEAEELDAGNPQELGSQYQALRRRMGHLTVLGGCCGTDHRHVEAICTSVLAA